MGTSRRTRGKSATVPAKPLTRNEMRRATNIERRTRRQKLPTFHWLRNDPVDFSRHMNGIKEKAISELRRDPRLARNRRTIEENINLEWKWTSSPEEFIRLAGEEKGWGESWSEWQRLRVQSIGNEKLRADRLRRNRLILQGIFNPNNCFFFIPVNRENVVVVYVGMQVKERGIANQTKEFLIQNLQKDWEALRTGRLPFRRKPKKKNRAKK